MRVWRKISHEGNHWTGRRLGEWPRSRQLNLVDNAVIIGDAGLLGERWLRWQMFGCNGNFTEEMNSMQFCLLFWLFIRSRLRCLRDLLAFILRNEKIWYVSGQTIIPHPHLPLLLLSFTNLSWACLVLVSLLRLLDLSWGYRNWAKLFEPLVKLKLCLSKGRRSLNQNVKSGSMYFISVALSLETCLSRN